MRSLLGARRMRRPALAAVVALGALVAIAGTVLADPGALFGSNDNPWPDESHGGRAPFSRR